MSKNSQFEKFINKTRGSAIKEQFKQEKKLAKKERAEAIEKRFEEKRKAKYAPQEPAPRPREDQARKTASRSQAPANPVVPKTASPKTGSPRSGSRATDSPLPVSKRINSQNTKSKPSLPAEQQEPQMPLNKYIAHSGISGRREAAELVKSGEVTVNNQIVTEPGTKVSESDVVKVKGKKITPSKNFVYILLNKPKDYITTTEDPQGRKTVLDLLRNATSERVYPIGRLDRNTSGVLLFTNDGELAQTLSHPSHEVKKIYEVRLDKDLAKNDFDKLLQGITLDDGFISPDALAYADSKDKSIIGIEIHSGRNRIVRRIFEKLGYDVRGLDRVMYAGLTKKNVQRGKWRMLEEKEVRILKHFNKKDGKK
jgi:23S rRNA pseudouridine2605 synthase